VSEVISGFLLRPDLIWKLHSLIVDDCFRRGGCRDFLVEFGLYRIRHLAKLGARRLLLGGS
jgi:hypothetical protein